jgi:hypothetical protein
MTTYIVTTKSGQRIRVKAANAPAASYAAMTQGFRVERAVPERKA